VFLSEFNSFTTFTILPTPPVSAPNVDIPTKIGIKGRTPPFFGIGIILGI